MNPSSDALVEQLRAAGCVFAEDEAAALQAEYGGEALVLAVERRCAGEPLEHILGWAEFAGERITVTTAVFVPRRRSELLVDEALALLEPHDIVLDLCCGSGPVGAVIARRRPDVTVLAADIDPVSTRCAERNLGAGHVFTGDLYDAIPAVWRGRVGVVVANAPYVPTGEIGSMPAEARDHEPRVALDGGADGLDVVRRVADGASQWLRAGGSVFIECSRRQAPTAAAIVTECGLAAAVIEDDERAATAVRGTVVMAGGQADRVAVTRNPDSSAASSP